MIHLLAHLSSLIALLVYEAVHVANLAVNYVKETLYGRFTFLSVGLREFGQLLNSPHPFCRNLVLLALLENEEHFALRLLTPTKHVNVGERVDFSVAIHVDEVSHLILSYYINNWVLLVFGHDQL